MTIRQVGMRLAIGVLLLAGASSVPATGTQVALPQTPSVHAAARQPAEVDWPAIEQALGTSGTLMPGNVFRIGMPRSDLDVSVAGVPVQANFALGSYAAFKPLDDGSGMAMVMGDLVLLDEEVPGVMSGLFANGLQITALHNHLNQVTPHVLYLHYEGMGDPVQLAGGLHAALAASGTPLGGSTPGPPYSGPHLDTDTLQGILGRPGRQMDNGVFAVSVPRAETITQGAMELPPAMGTATAINFQPTEEGKAAITGDFVLLAEEVNAVASTLRAHGIEVTALHSHTLGDQPRLFYLHFWANDDPAKLATGLRAALDQTHAAPAS
jgi:hypothetical protein